MEKSDYRAYSGTNINNQKVTEKQSRGGGGYYLMFDAARTSIALVRSGCSSSLRSTGVREHFSFIPREIEFGILTVGSQLVFDHRFILIHS